VCEHSRSPLYTYTYSLSRQRCTASTAMAAATSGGQRTLGNTLSDRRPGRCARACVRVCVRARVRACACACSCSRGAGVLCACGSCGSVDLSGRVHVHTTCVHMGVLIGGAALCEWFLGMYMCMRMTRQHLDTFRTILGEGTWQGLVSISSRFHRCKPTGSSTTRLW
jgi:hypothetical protein